MGGDRVTTDNRLQGRRIGFIGGGNMAEAIIRGLLAGGIAGEAIRVAEPVAVRREFLAKTYAVRACDDNGAVAADAELLVLAVKPQVAPAVLAQLREEIGTGTLVVSIMAGVPCSALEAPLQQGVRVVRVMPNTPSLVLEGASALCGGSSAGPDDLALAEALFALVGTTCRVDEKLMDAVTGLSGSGPAYALAFIEALADGGVKNGIPRDTALALAAQTLLGTARLLRETGEHPAALRDKVSSPGGTTIAGLYALEQGCLRGTVISAVDAATARSKELGK